MYIAIPAQTPARRSRFILPDILSEVTFDLIPLRFTCRARRGFRLDANTLRGVFGKALHTIDRAAYQRVFDPHRDSTPSGLKDAPRPFVLRVREKTIAAGELFEFGFHLFDRREPVDLIARAFGEVAEIERVESEMLRLPLEPSCSASKIRVTFVTPTELKGADRPDFGVLLARVRDRTSTLRALYGDGPLEIDFKAMGERAATVAMTRCEIEHVEAERTSRATGQTHSLGGFTGVAEYEGELGEFLPYLEIARYTGVGRQTVWGKGEIDYETF